MPVTPTPVIRPKNRFSEVSHLDDTQKIEAVYKNIEDLYMLLSGFHGSGWVVSPSVGGGAETFAFMMMEV